MRILGIDPGTRTLGYGLIDVLSSSRPASGSPGLSVRHVESAPLYLAGPLPSRLEEVYMVLSTLVERTQPTVVAIETVFHGKNFESVLKLGEARGVVLLAAQMAGKDIHEYSPAQVKKTVTGRGNATKDQVQRMIGRLLDLEPVPAPTDVSDALAVAYCCSEDLRKDYLLALAAGAPQTGVDGSASPGALPGRVTPARSALEKARRETPRGGMAAAPGSRPNKRRKGKDA